MSAKSVNDRTAFVAVTITKPGAAAVARIEPLLSNASPAVTRPDPCVSTRRPRNTGTISPIAAPMPSTTPASIDDSPSVSRKSGTISAADIAAPRFHPMLTHV